MAETGTVLLCALHQAEAGTPGLPVVRARVTTDVSDDLYDHLTFCVSI